MKPSRLSTHPDRAQRARGFALRKRAGWALNVLWPGYATIVYLANTAEDAKAQYARDAAGGLWFQ